MSDKQEPLTLDERLDALLADPSPPIRVCGVAHVIDQMPPETADKVRRLIDAGVASAPRIADLLTAAGFKVADQTISRHRRRGTGSGCSCPAK